MVQGFKDEDGKFHPTETKQGISSDDVVGLFDEPSRVDPSSAIELKNNKEFLSDKFGITSETFRGRKIKSDFTDEALAKDFFDNKFWDHPSEWSMILSGDGFEIDNENINTNVPVDWEDLSEKDKKTITDYFIQEQKEGELSDRVDAQIREIIREDLSKELSTALGYEVDQLNVHIGTTGFTDENGFPKSTELTLEAKKLDEDSIKNLKKSGFTILETSLGVNVINFKMDKKL